MLTLRIIQHVPFEGPANIAIWAEENNHTVQYTKMYDGDDFPEINNYDILVVMGGPMGVSSTVEYPWVEDELLYIKKVINADKPVIGICLGAQFIAKALGANVYKGPQKEIGWFPLIFESSLPKNIQHLFPKTLNTFHWHGDTFDIPEGANKLAHTIAVPNQGFIYNNKVIALQFHVEMNESSIAGMIKECADDITDGDYIQSPTLIESGLIHQAENYFVLANILTYLSGRLN